ncbi:MAG: hypothetical protein II812_09200 [Prevotella sp.]|nr:hypothetical protein [Prevotella sp.]
MIDLGQLISLQEREEKRRRRERIENDPTVKNLRREISRQRKYLSNEDIPLTVEMVVRYTIHTLKRKLFKQMNRYNYSVA